MMRRCPEIRHHGVATGGWRGVRKHSPLDAFLARVEAPGGVAGGWKTRPWRADPDPWLLGPAFASDELMEAGGLTRKAGCTV